MALACARRLLPTIVAQIVQQLGWDAVHQSVMDVLVDILDRNLTTICGKVHFFAELDGRTVPDLDDLGMAFRDLGVNLHDLLDYVTEMEPSTLVVEVPQFPVSAEKVKSLLNAGKSVPNNVETTKSTEEQRTEAEDGSRAASLGTPGTVTTPGAADKKAFSNETGTSKRLRLLPDEAMHSQYEMKSFLVTDSGSFIPIRSGIRASARCASPSTPRRPAQPSPVMPVYITEKSHVMNEIENTRTFEPEMMMFHTKHVKKSSKMPKDSLHKMLKHGVKKPKKISHVGSSGHGKLPKPLKAEKALLNKSKSSSGGNSSSGKKSSDHSTPRASDKAAKEMFPGDLIQFGDDVHLDKELQKSRIRSYEDSINTVVLNSSQDAIKFIPDEFCAAPMLPPVPRLNIADNRVTPPADNFYLDLVAPSPPTPSPLFDHRAAERDAHINSTIDDVIKASSLDDDLGMSPEPGESDVEIEQKQSAVEDIFDVSSVPSPRLPTAWPVNEEVIIEEPIVTEIIEFSNRTTPSKKSKKSKPKTADKANHGFDSAVKKSEDRGKKSKHHPIEQPAFDASSLGGWSEDEWDRKPKTPLEQLAVLSEASFAKNTDSWNRKSKHQTSEYHSNADFVPTHGKGRDEFDKKFKHSDFDSLPPHIYNDESNKKQKLHHTNDDFVATRGDDKKPKHRSSRSAFTATPEPPRATDHPVDLFANSQDPRQSFLNEWPKVRLESAGFEDEKRTSKKRPFPYSPTPPLRESPLPFAAPSYPLLPRSPSPPLAPSLVPCHVDASCLPPLKRIKIVSSAGIVNQFEIKEPSQSTSAAENDHKRDKKEKKKSKKNKDRERSRDHKDRNRSYDPSDHEQDRYARDRENKDSIKTNDSFLNRDPSPSSSFFEDKTRRKADGGLQINAVFVDRDKRSSKIGSDKHHQKMIVQSSAEDLSKRVHESQFAVGRNSAELRAEHKWKGDDWTKEKSLGFRDEESDRPRSKSHKKKDRSRSRDEGKASKKDDRHKDRTDKFLEKSEHKKKKSEKNNEMPIEPAPVQLPTIPKITLKFGTSATGAPSLSRTTEPSVSQPAFRTAEPPTNPPIKLRFKTGFSCLPNSVSSPSLADQSLFGLSRSPAKVAVPPQPSHPVLEMPTFSPSPESISIPSPNDSSGSDLFVVGRARTPTPPSLSIPGPIMPRPHIPFYTSSSSSSSHSLSPPLLHLPKEVDGHAASFSTRKSAPLPSVPVVDQRAPKLDAGSKTLKMSLSAKTTSQKSKSSSKVVTPPPPPPAPRVSSHTKGIPPSKIMPPATPVQPLIPVAKAPLSSAKSGSNKSKKRVTTETVSKVVNEDGVVTWICPACLVEDKGEEPMIGCDECDDWYHWRCVGVLVEPPEEIPWYCRRCQVKSKVLLKTPNVGRGKGKKSKKK